MCRLIKDTQKTMHLHWAVIMCQTRLSFEEAKFSKTGSCHRWIDNPILECQRGCNEISIGYYEAAGLNGNSLRKG